MTRRRRTTAFVVVAMLAVGVSALACLILLRTPAGSAVGDVTQLRSPDSRWVLADRYVETGLLASNPALTRAVLARADGSDARTVYLGEPATAKWLGSSRVVFTEEESGRRHVIAVPGGSYDYRFDQRANLAAFVVYTMIPGAVVFLVGAIIRHTSRSASRQADGGVALARQPGA